LKFEVSAILLHRPWPILRGKYTDDAEQAEYAERVRAALA
jgi:hypothetical protein